MDCLYHRDRLRTFSTVLVFLAFQAPCSFTSRPTQTSDNDSQKRFIAEKSKNVSAIYPSVTSPLSPRHFSNLITHSGTTGVMSTGNTVSSCELTVCSSEVLPWTRARNNQGDSFRVFYQIRGWFILCVILTGVAFLLVTHHLANRRVQPRFNCCRTFC